MNKHTPGPWHIQDDHGKRWIETGGNDDTIAEIHRRKDKGSVYSCGEALANAHLIAAAPDLLDALERMVKCAQKQNWNDHYPEELAASYLAIDRARGAE